MPEVFIAAGSNVAPERHLAQAVAEIAREFPGARFSPWYRNHPAAGSGEDFINLAAGFSTALSAREVQQRLRAIEARCGRLRGEPRQAPPSVDLDLLLYGDLLIAEPQLTVPRPELLTRAYLLGPLAALAPQALHPGVQLSIGELWRRFDHAAHPLERLGS
jgi:2-amino-4-hydroxy-6-hydroxymethyldihydropteridine diphosphokinase